MSKFKKIFLRAYVTLLLASVLAVPGFAASSSSTTSNAVGAGEGSSPLLAFCYYYAIKQDIEIDFSAFDGSIYRIDGTGDSKSLSNCWLYFVFRMPPHEPDLSFDFAFDFPLTATRCISQAAYPTSTGFHLSTGYYEFTDSEFGSYNDSSYGDGRAWVRCSSDDFPSYSEYRTIALYVPSGSIDFYANGKIGGLDLTPSIDSSAISLSGHSSAVTAKFSPRSSSRWDSSLNLFTINTTSSGIQYIRLAQFGTTGNLYSMFSDSPVSIPQTSVSVSGSVRNPSYSASSAELSSSNNILMYGQLNYTYHNDGGIVDNVAHMTDTLDGIADNMQTVIDDMQAHKDAGEDIGGTTSTETISGTQETLSSGTQSFDTFTDTATDQLDTITSGASGYASLMTMAVPVILNFGPSSIGPLHIALLVIVAIFGLSFFVRRLL